jgi:hypothetical protein
MYAALCKAVAAAALRKACDFASASFFAQSGRTISVVITVLSVTASDVALLRPGPAEVGEFRDEVEDIADVALPIPLRPWPL